MTDKETKRERETEEGRLNDRELDRDSEYDYLRN